MNPDQRASDSDRDRVIEILQSAAADGRLDFDEFNERMSAASRAKTFGELEPLTADLGSGASVDVPHDEVVIRAHGSSVQRTGRWVVPSKVVVKTRLSSPLLDFRHATLTTSDVEIALDCNLGTVKLVVPDGTAIVADDLVTEFGQVKIRVRESPSPPLRLRLTGRTGFSSVIVRRSGFWERRKNSL